jgi:aspartate/methionine/tyrosine aminotransferase
MIPTTSSRMQAVQAPIIPIVGRWTRETPGTVSLGQGMVSYGPPQEAIEALRRFGSAADHHAYGPVEGQPELIAAIEHKLARENGISVRPDSRVVVTAGGNMAFVNAALAVADPGDEFVFPVPFYFNHEMAVAIAGCRPVPVLTGPEYQLDLDAIAAAITPRTRAVVTVSPNNPSGAVYPEETLRAVNALCASRGIYHIHDEVYEYFTYDGATHFSPGAIAGAARHTITLSSMSKAYGFAGWRIGYMVVPDGLFDAVDKIQDTNLICPPRASQEAALAALRVGRRYCAPMVESLDAVRRTVLATLHGLGDLCETPAVRGAFYCLVRVRTDLPVMTLVERLIREHRVAVIPGSAFGLEGPVVRLSYGALDAATVSEGIGRLAEAIRRLAL